MLSTKRIMIVIGSFVCISGYVAWMNHLDSSDLYQLANVRETDNLVNTNPVIQNQFKHDKYISLINKMQEQLSTQQDQLKKQQTSINTLFTRLNEKEIYSSVQLSGNDSENLALETEEENSTKQVERLDIAFANEAIDEKWSNLATDKVSELFNKMMPEGSDITQLDCQTTFCKIVLEHLDETELESFLDDFIFKLGWETSSFIQTTDYEDGSKSTIVYLSRDGYSLPET